LDDRKLSETDQDEVQPVPAKAHQGKRRTLAFQLAAVALTVVSALAGTGLARWLRAPDAAPKETKPAEKKGLFPGRVFHDWTKPDLVVLITGQQHGYILPCGCSKPQVGGLERRYNFMQMLKAAGWPYVAVDVGDVPQRHGPAGLPNQQAMLKYLYSMKSLKLMGYAAVGFGEYEANMGLFNVLAEFALNDKPPHVLGGNLMEAERHFPEMTVPWKAVESGEKSGIKVGVTSVVGPNVAARIRELTRGDDTIKFEATPNAINRVLTDMAAKGVNLPVLLYQGPVNRPGQPQTEATACAKAYPQFPFVVAISDEDEPPSRPVEVATKTGKSMVIAVGKKGKFVGVVGVWKTGNAEKPFTYRYERVELTEPEFLTAEENQKNHPVMELMESYTRDLKTQNFLEKYGQVRHAVQVMPDVKGLTRPVPVTYVGSEKCKRCHEHAYEVWKKTPHAHAYDTLVVKAKQPGNRQYDPECIVCHTVGFGYKSGYVNETKTSHLKNVGCESCHGPGSVHVLNPNDTTWHQRINPWKYLPPNKRELATDQFCQKCHDQDNDVNWINGGFKRNWPKVEHNTPSND